jgi:hypothetical protein
VKLINKKVKKKNKKIIYEQMQCRLKALCVGFNTNEITLQEFLSNIGNNIKKQIFNY